MDLICCWCLGQRRLRSRMPGARGLGLCGGLIAVGEAEGSVRPLHGAGVNGRGAG